MVLSTSTRGRRRAFAADNKDSPPDVVARAWQRNNASRHRFHTLAARKNVKSDRRRRSRTRARRVLMGRDAHRPRITIYRHYTLATVTHALITRRDTAAAGPIPAGITPTTLAPRARQASIIRGNNLRIADLRSQLANINVAVTRSHILGA